MWLRAARERVSRTLRHLRLPARARAMVRRDRRGLDRDDPGPARAIEAGLRWLGRAQDHSRTRDGGVARHFSLLDGWAASYPETTGYIAATVIEQAHGRGDQELAARARRMLDWLVAIQFPDGGFQGGMVDQTPKVPVTFNTGQILSGLAAGVRAFGEPYRPAMAAAAAWLVATQDDDGKWSRHGTPFAAPGLKTYETHVARALFEAARVASEPAWGEAGLRQVRWAMTQIRPNGWPDHCCLNEATKPLTHTLGYALRGLIEAWRFAGDRAVLAVAERLAAGALAAMEEDGFLPGRLTADWQPAADWACVTGTAQLAECWLLLYEDTGEARWLAAGRRANRFVRRAQAAEGDPDLDGAVPGSFPIDGGYGTYQYLSWAVKFMIDANQRELDLAASGGRDR